MKFLDKIRLQLARDIVPTGYHVQKDGGGPRKPRVEPVSPDPVDHAVALLQEMNDRGLHHLPDYDHQVNSGMSHAEKIALRETEK